MKTLNIFLSLLIVSSSIYTGKYYFESVSERKASEKQINLLTSINHENLEINSGLKFIKSKIQSKILNKKDSLFLKDYLRNPLNDSIRKSIYTIKISNGSFRPLGNSRVPLLRSQTQVALKKLSYQEINNIIKKIDTITNSLSPDFTKVMIGYPDTAKIDKDYNAIYDDVLFSLLYFHYRQTQYKPIIPKKRPLKSNDLFNINYSSKDSTVNINFYAK